MLQPLWTNVGSLQSDIQDIRRQLNDKAGNYRISTLNSKMDSLEYTIGEICSRLDSMEYRLQELEKDKE